jgi:hypothetical protein
MQPAWRGSSSDIGSGEAFEVRGNRTGKGWFVKGRSGNPSGRTKSPPKFAPDADGPAGADRRTVGNLVIEARKFSGLAVDTLVDLTKDNHTDSTRFAAATALLDRAYGRPSQSLDLHLSADAITKRLSDMTDAEPSAASPFRAARHIARCGSIDHNGRF